MTRTPRLNHHLHEVTQHLRTVAGRLRVRRPASLSRKTVAYAGAGLALAGVTGATAAAGFAGHPDRVAGAAGAPHTVSRSVADSARHTPAGHSAPASKSGTSGQATTSATTKRATRAAHAAAGHQTAGGHGSAQAHSGPAHPAPRHPAAKQHPAAKHGTQAKQHAAAHHARTWAAVSRIVAKRTYPKPGHGQLPAQDQLTPVGTSGPQAWMPITTARWENAKTIVRQAIAKHMGLRSAVIAVATSMQESGLLNLNYGDRDSLGLFQQRPSCGWGAPTQIEHPAYAANAFLQALHGYQASNPGWAHQPLWAAAQGVQGSAFPSAYAKWEAQAAHLVASVTKHLV